MYGRQDAIRVACAGHQRLGRQCVWPRGQRPHRTASDHGIGVSGSRYDRHQGTRVLCPEGGPERVDHPTAYARVRVGSGIDDQRDALVFLALVPFVAQTPDPHAAQVRVIRLKTGRELCNGVIGVPAEEVEDVEHRRFPLIGVPGEGEEKCGQRDRTAGGGQHVCDLIPGDEVLVTDVSLEQAFELGSQELGGGRAQALNEVCGLPAPLVVATGGQLRHQFVERLPQRRSFGMPVTASHVGDPTGGRTAAVSSAAVRSRIRRWRSARRRLGAGPGW